MLAAKELVKATCHTHSQADSPGSIPVNTVNPLV
jgi:hypothetical protein